MGGQSIIALDVTCEYIIWNQWEISLNFGEIKSVANRMWICLGWGMATRRYKWCETLNSVYGSGGGALFSQFSGRSWTGSMTNIGRS